MSKTRELTIQYYSVSQFEHHHWKVRQLHQNYSTQAHTSMAQLSMEVFVSVGSTVVAVKWRLRATKTQNAASLTESSLSASSVVDRYSSSNMSILATLPVHALASVHACAICAMHVTLPVTSRQCLTH